MRLLTHNKLTSKIKGVTNNYPLLIEVETAIVIAEKFEDDYLKKVFDKINWKALVYASEKLGYTELPDEAPDASERDKGDFWQRFHHALLERHLQEGELICPETGRRFPVVEGVPNMALRVKMSDEEIEGNNRDNQDQVMNSDDSSSDEFGSDDIY